MRNILEVTSVCGVILHIECMSGVPRPELSKLYSVELDRAPGMLLKAEVESRVCRQAADWEQGEKEEVSKGPQICGPRDRRRGSDLVTVIML